VADAAADGPSSLSRSGTPRLPDLPVGAVLPELLRALAAGRSTVLTASPGSGKTTLVPLALLDEPWLAGGAILVSAPRRIAARAAAARMAELLGEPVGETVGYRVRFDQRVSARTRVEVITEGILVRRIQGDPGLAGVGLVVLDELHERSLLADLALALVRDVQEGLREDLRLLLMSATLDAAALARALGGAAVVEGGGRSHPVEVRYLPRSSTAPVPVVTAEAVRRALAPGHGDVLAFLPGGREIRAAAERLGDLPGTEVLALHGDLPAEVQDRALRPAAPGRRRVVLATPIAETSLTIEGVAAVVDSGLARRPRFDPASGLTRLETVRVSRASADQRAGRAGRLGPGVCHRLWTEGTQRTLAAQTPPEILDADLAPLVLELAQWGVAGPEALRWLDPPPPGACAQARTLLEALGALDPKGRVTPLGRRMVGLPFHPRLSRMLLTALDRGEAALGCDLAALVSERDLLRGGGPRGVDLADRLAALRVWRRDGEAGARRAGADPVLCLRVDRAARQARQALGVRAGGEDSGTADRSAGALLASAYPDRVAQLQAGATGRMRLASGRGARLPEGDPLAGQAYLVAVHLDATAGDGRVFLAATLDPSDLGRLPGIDAHTVDVVDWDERARAVVARREERLGSLVLAARPLPDPDPGRVREVLLAALRRAGPGVLPWTPAARELQARVLSLRAWRPGEGWPDLSDAALLEGLEEWLGPELSGVTRLDHLARLDLLAPLQRQVGRDGLRRLDAGAPTHLSVPSGARRRLAYLPGEPPVLAVKLQELFGLADSPRVSWGEVPVILHLLSPAGRPIQVTADLRGFWERTYPEVRRELRGRYPRHPWPEDPWTAVPTAGVTRPRRPG
jgi:ATP-dependent helicase HrpB